MKDKSLRIIQLPTLIIHNNYSLSLQFIARMGMTRKGQCEMQCIMLPMYFCYVDESGDSGKVKSPTSWFVLAAVLVDDKRWRAARAHVVNFRRSLVGKFGVKFNDKLRASDIVHNRGDFRNSGMSFQERMALYEEAMQFQQKCGVMRIFRRRGAKGQDWQAGYRRYCLGNGHCPGEPFWTRSG